MRKCLRVRVRACARACVCVHVHVRRACSMCSFRSSSRRVKTRVSCSSSRRGMTTASVASVVTALAPCAPKRGAAAPRWRLPQPTQCPAPLARSSRKHSCPSSSSSRITSATPPERSRKHCTSQSAARYSTCPALTRATGALAARAASTSSSVSRSSGTPRSHATSAALSSALRSAGGSSHTRRGSRLPGCTATGGSIAGGGSTLAAFRSASDARRAAWAPAGCATLCACCRLR